MWDRERLNHGSAGAREGERLLRSSGSAGSMQGTGSDTNLWQRSPGCVRGKLLAGDTGREKRYRESKKGCGCLGLARAGEGAEERPWPSRGWDKPADGHVSSRKEGVTVREQRDPQLPGRDSKPSLPCTQAALPHQRCAAPKPAPLSCCLPWQRSPSQRSRTSHDQDNQQPRHVPQPRGSASASIPGNGSCRPFPTQACCLAHAQQSGSLEHTMVPQQAAHHQAASSTRSRHGTAAQPSPSTQAEPAHKCNDRADSLHQAGDGMECPCCKHGAGECSRMCSDPNTSQPGSWFLLWVPQDR